MPPRLKLTLSRKTSASNLPPKYHPNSTPVALRHRGGLLLPVTHRPHAIIATIIINSQPILHNFRELIFHLWQFSL
jgi:hypothetical protein